MNLDRLFRSITIEEYPNIFFEAGTIDKTKLKSCYIEIKGTFEVEGEDRLKSFNRVCRNISQTISSVMDKDLFREEFILNKNIANSFVNTGKSFTKLEYTLFPKRPTTFKEIEIELNKISKRVWTNDIQDTDRIKFHKKMLTKRRYAKKS